tara:strand:+ start:16131 stop:16460 length:330 start_codon:yes stop_codon:yes gene_type:complete
MELLEEYEKKRNELFNYFGYVENWKVIPVDDATSCYWRLDNDESSGSVLFADNEYDLINETGDHYSNEIYTQRHLPKWVYRGKDYTMICVDTHTDGNKLLQIFKNSLER